MNVEFGLPFATLIGSHRLRSANIRVIVPLCVLRDDADGGSSGLSRILFPLRKLCVGKVLVLFLCLLLLPQCGFLGRAKSGFVFFPLSSWPRPAHELFSSPILILCASHPWLL